MVTIPEEYFEVESCIYRLSYGDRFVIVKGKTLTGSIYLIERGYRAFLTSGGGTGRQRGGEGQNEWDGVNAYYFKLYKYIHDHPNQNFKVEVLLESNNHYQLLKAEEDELQKELSNPKCFNSNVSAYIPVYRKKSGMYGWINKGSVLAFKRYLKND